MAMNEQQLRELAAMVAASMGKSARKPHLSIVSTTAPSPGLGAMQRDVIYSRIGDLVTQYNLGWLLRQDSMHVLGVIECLPDEELLTLLGRLECAVECFHEGVPFVERGLVKGSTCNWIA